MSILEAYRQIDKIQWDHGRKQRRRAFLMSCTRQELDVIRNDLGQRIETTFRRLVG